MSIGKIITANTSVAYCEFTGSVEQDTYLFYQDGDRKVSVRVTYLQNNPRGGLLGHVAIAGLVHKPAPAGTELHLDNEAPQAPGIRLDLAVDLAGRPVPIRLNALFLHWLMAGVTQKGKTHLAIAASEELVKLRVPLLILDLQNEFTGLKQVFPDIVVDGDIEPAVVLKHLRDRKVVVVPMLGAGDEEKARRAAGILQHLYDAKEADHAKGTPKLPPMLAILDEAEVLAPSDKCSPGEQQRTCRDVVQNILKRGSKLGLGAILLCQRVPMLHVESRSQCNNLALFGLDDLGSLGQMKLKGLTKYELELVGRLPAGQCILRGPMVARSAVVHTRAIVTPRTKDVNFEHLLGFSQPAAVPERQPDVGGLHVPAPSLPVGGVGLVGQGNVDKSRRMPRMSSPTIPKGIEIEFHAAQLAKLCQKPTTTEELFERARKDEPRLSVAALCDRLEAAHKAGLLGKGKRFRDGMNIDLWTAKPGTATLQAVEA